jgi:hypothetical protein
VTVSALSRRHHWQLKTGRCRYRRFRGRTKRSPWAAIRLLARSLRRSSEGDGKAKLKTVEGDTLTISGSGKDLMVTDDKGNTAKVTIVDVYQSNGVIMVIDKVLMPN